MQIVFTIGHFTHTQEHLINRIMAVCDVRSTPHTRLNAQFNREELKTALPASGIEYCFLGKELGARSHDPACYEGGKVQYDRLAETALFKYGQEYTFLHHRVVALNGGSHQAEPMEGVSPKGKI